MRIGVDVSPLLVRSAGVKTYTYHLVRALTAMGGAHRISTFPVSFNRAELIHDRSSFGKTATLAGLTRLTLANLMPLGAGLTLPSADVFHASNLLRTARATIPLTTTLHDLTTRLMPELQSATNLRCDDAFEKYILSRANGIICVSEHTRQDAGRVFRLKAETAVIHPGVAEAYFQPRSDTEIELVRRRYGIDRPYALFAGTIEPRKNIELLLEAWSGTARSIRDAFDLIVAGPAGWADPGLLARLNSGGDGGRYLGYVPGRDLPHLMAGASTFIFPSLYEGWGFPVAEAMAAGVPVVTSNGSSLPEVVGAAALLVDPRSVTEVRAAIERVLLSPTLRAELSAKGRTRARELTWAHCAAQTISFFEHIAGR